MHTMWKEAAIDMVGFLAFLLPDEKKQPSGKLIKVNLLILFCLHNKRSIFLIFF